MSFFDVMLQILTSFFLVGHVCVDFPRIPLLHITSTVDGRNPARVNGQCIPSFTGFYTSHVVH